VQYLRESIYISLILFIFPFLAIAEHVEMDTLVLDGKLSVAFPAAYETSNILSQEVYSVKFEKQSLVLSKFEADKHHNTSIPKLKLSYKKFLKGMMERVPDSKVISKELRTVDSLICQQAKFSAQTEKGKMIFEVIAIIIQNNNYAIQSIYPEGDSSAVLVEFETILESFEFLNLTSEDQIEERPKVEGEENGSLAYTVVLVFLLLCLAGFIYFIVRNAKK